MALVKHIAKFTQTPNELLSRSDISLKAKGLWTFLNSKPEGWNFSVNGTKAQNKDGKESVSSGIKELEKFGYLQRKAVKDSSGQWNGYDYHLFETPTFVPDSGIPVSEIPIDGKPDNGEPSNHSNTLESNTIQSNTVIESTPEINFEDVIDPKKESLFRNSAVFDFKIFELKMSKEKELGVDLNYYYQSVLDWSNKKNKLYRTAIGWISTARGFMRSDQNKGNLVVVKSQTEESQEAQEMAKYLNR